MFSFICTNELFKKNNNNNNNKSIINMINITYTFFSSISLLLGRFQ